MMETDILFSDEFRRLVEENLDRDPVQIALDGKVPHAALVASQVKYLRRAVRKLPSYYAAHCILPSLAFEQSSGEETAARKNYSGKLCVDLTCGLGVDSFFLSKRFERVIAVERDLRLAAIARENFRRLGACNIEVVNAPAEEYLTNADISADLIYADPDRRSSEGKKMVRIEDCSPDIIALLPRIRQISPRFVVKLSPLFDVDEVFRVFGRNTRVEVVSLNGECKEIIAEITGDISTPSICAVAIGRGEAEYPFGEKWNVPEREFTPGHYRFLIVPDVALQKARLARRYFSERGVCIDSDNGYGFYGNGHNEIISASKFAGEALPGRVYEIESIEPFDPKTLRKRLKTEGIKSIDILRHNFPLSTTDIARRLGIREGGAKAIAFTCVAGHLWQIHLTKR